MKTLFRVDLFENVVFACTYGQTKVELLENAEDTLYGPIHPRNIRNLFKMAGRLFPFLSSNTYASGMRSRVSYRFQIDSS